jgi:hypothetical protein
MSGAKEPSHKRLENTRRGYGAANENDVMEPT